MASASFMRNGIIGKRRGLPLVQIPVVSSLTMSASLAESWNIGAAKVLERQNAALIAQEPR